MRTPTPEQQAVIADASRVRLVRAAPGSGKTWLVAEIIRKELEHWDRNRGGIAALSFTRVGGEEIRHAIGSDLVHPHFVGTLDAFLFRYVVRPFLQQACPGAARPRLIPAEWSPEQWSKPPAGVEFIVLHGTGKRKAPYNAFSACFVGENEGRMCLGYPEAFRSGLRILDDSIAQPILHTKKKLWTKLGWLTHSDAAFLAALILADVKAGPTVLAELTRRFPFVIVDELQDTGWFLGQSLKSILAVATTRGLLVGDPDQAIYEFNGARPDLFDGFAEIAGAVELTLGTTLRCGSAVCRVADQLSQTGRTIQPNEGQSGRALLLRYADVRGDITRLRQHLSSEMDAKRIRMIARHHSTITAVVGRPPNEPVKLGSPPLNHMQRAVSLFRAARQANALAAAKASVGLAVFGNDGCEDSELAQCGVEPGEWKQLVVECLLRANEEVTGESLYDWGVRTAEAIQERLKLFVERSQNRIEVPTIKKPQCKHKETERSGFLFKPQSVAQTGPSIPIQTVHAVKGETHDTTVFICPPLRRNDRCPSAVWWSENSADLEERRIAYVAVTRTQGDLIVCVCEQTWERLRSERPGFVELFESGTIDQLISRTIPGTVSETPSRM